MRWTIEQIEYEIKYQLRLAMKGQVMADFIAETPQKSHQDANSLKNEWWILHVNGASYASGSGMGLLLQSPTEERLE